MFDLSGYIGYRRTTHHPDGRPKFISRTQEDIWEKHWPIGNMIPFKEFVNAEYIHDHTLTYIISAKLVKYVSLEETREILTELAGASLVEARFGLSWPS